MHDWVNGVIWHQLCDATLWIQLLCNPATLQPVSLGGAQLGGGQSSHWEAVVPGPLATPKNRLCIYNAKHTVSFINLLCKCYNDS